MILSADDAPAPAFPQAATIRRHIGMLKDLTLSKMRFAVIGFAGRLCLAVALLLSLDLPTSAETIAETAKQWGLIGPWSLDCSLPPDHAKGTVLIYEANGDRLIHRRDFGDSRDEAEVLSATVSDDGILNLRVYFPSMKQTREYGMMHVDDSSIRAVYNRDEKNKYSIKDGKFTANGKPTPAQHRCERPPA
jgi:hypothetical protein